MAIFSEATDLGFLEEFAANLISKEANPEANIIWGAAFDSSLEDEMKVTVVATGFDAPSTKTVQKPVFASEDIITDDEEAAGEQTKTSGGIDDDIANIFGKSRSNIGGGRFSF